MTGLERVRQILPLAPTKAFASNAAATKVLQVFTDYRNIIKNLREGSARLFSISKLKLISKGKMRGKIPKKNKKVKMKIMNRFTKLLGTLIMLALLIPVFGAGCGDKEQILCPISGNPDTALPTVIFTNPVDGDTVDGSQGVVVINATFSESMNPLSVDSESFTVTGPGSTPVAGAVSYDAANRRASMVPADDLPLETYFTATITTNTEDISGNPMASDYIWHFSTLDGVSDTTHPYVASTIPDEGDTVDGTQGMVVINATFSEAMNPSTINSTSFMVTGPGLTPVAGDVSYDVAHRRASFVPADDLPLDTYFTATITTMAEDNSGDPMDGNHVWHFSTFAFLSEQLPINLLSCAEYAVIGGSTITNTGPTNITGNVGLSPGTALVGFPPGIIVGETHIADPAAAQAKLDLTAAYNAAAGRTLNPVTLSGNIGGMTLPPGLYKSTSTLEISSGDLTLDAGGNANAVWIFQIASSFTTTVGRAVVLSGGADANNIFWQVGTSATLGVTSIFKGTILCDQSITMNTGAVVDGRVLTRIAAVSLDNNIIVRPTP